MALDHRMRRNTDTINGIFVIHVRNLPYYVNTEVLRLAAKIL